MTHWRRRTPGPNWRGINWRLCLALLGLVIFWIVSLSAVAGCTTTPYDSIHEGCWDEDNQLRYPC